jgi:uncharacterized protein YggE
VLHRLIVCSIALGLPAIGSAQPVSRQHDGPPVVVTTGEATVKRTPDRVWITIAAESRARTPREAQKLNADAMSAVMQKLKGAGLPADAIRTTSYDLQPEFDYNNGRQTVRGYVARNGIEVRLDQIDRAGDILELAVGAGATTVSGVRFDLKDRAGAEREALSLAVADARARASAAAAGAGLSVSHILRIDEHRASMPEPRPMMMAMQREMAAAGSAPPITPGELEIRASVTLTAVIK